jgi:hypothetical protein
MTAPVPCHLCGQAPRDCRMDIDQDAVDTDCERCGRFSITSTALSVLRPEDKPGLSAFCRRASPGKSIVRITYANIQELINSLPKYSPPEKLDNLLQLMAAMSPRFDQYSTFDSRRDYPLLVAAGPEEVDYLTLELQKRGYLDGTHDGLALTMLGWEHLEEIRRSGASTSRAFVAMWFDDSMNSVYDESIKPAIVGAGYEPLRIDRHEHVNRIDDEIIGQIRRSRFMVADFTGQRHGVYFEAGLMLGLGRRVIWMCAKEELNKEGGLHFDIRQFNFIAYESPEDARKRLYDRILAIEGEGPNAEKQA